MNSPSMSYCVALGLLPFCGTWEGLWSHRQVYGMCSGLHLTPVPGCQVGQWQLNPWSPQLTENLGV